MGWRWYLNGALVGLILFGACGVSWGYLAAQYTLVPLQGRPNTIAKDDGRVVGELITGGCDATGCFPAQLYPTFALLAGLDAGNAFGTRAGQIVGRGEFPNQPYTHAFLYTSTPTDIGVLWDQENYSSASCVTSEGDVWGDGIIGNVGWVPIYWPKGANPIVLATLGGPQGKANACSERGDGAGASMTPDGTLHCTYWPGAAGVFDCHPGSGTTESGAVDMNYSAQIAANAVQFGHTYGYLWLFHTIIWLMPLPGDAHSVVSGLNDKSDPVGRSCPDNPSGADPREGICRAVGWELGHTIELLPRVTNAQGWTLNRAIGIDNAGRIVVRGFSPSGPEQDALLIPVETPVTAYFQWRWVIYDYYIRRYFLWIRAGGG
jgi:hypothetical protein